MCVDWRWCARLQLAEISRVLRPGGVFVASTFLKAAAPLGAILGDDAVRPLNQVCSKLAESYALRIASTFQFPKCSLQSGYCA